MNSGEINIQEDSNKVLYVNDIVDEIADKLATN